jgi:hypothetical protein
MNKKFIVLVYKLKKQHNGNRGLRENKKEKTKVAV